MYKLIFFERAGILRERVLFYDILRGFLIISMIYFHVVLATHPSPHLKIFVFTTVGFILISGIIIGQFSKVKENYGKLVVRGIKLLIIFSFLNLLGWSVFGWAKGSYWEIVVLGNPDITSFDILVPIGYMLLFSKVIDSINYQKTTLFLLFSVLLALDYLHNAFNYGHCYNIYLLVVGFIGISLGKLTNIEAVFSIYSKNPKIIASVFFAMGCSFYFVYFYSVYSAIHVFNAYMLFYMLKYFQNYIPFLQNKLAFLGQHSLFLYLSHIIILKLLMLNFSFLEHNNYMSALIFFIIVTIFTIIILQINIFLSKNNKLYNAVSDFVFR